MNKIILSVIVIFLLPISVFGFEWTVKYDMKKSDGSYEFVELSVPIVKGSWELPNQVGSWICSVDRSDYDTHTSGSLHCHSKKDEPYKMLTSMIGCNMRNTKSNNLGVNYPSNSKGIPNTVIVLKCGL